MTVRCLAYSDGFTAKIEKMTFYFRHEMICFKGILLPLVFGAPYNLQ